MTANVDLWMKFDDEYQGVLSIPLDDCQRFAIHPLAWLRYVAFTIYGNEGNIFLKPDGEEEVDYLELNIQPGDYYYVSQGESYFGVQRFLVHLQMLEPFLLDPDLMDDRTSLDGSQMSTARGDFAQRVKGRDGTCVMTGDADYPVACHIIPHAKGHEYIINLIHHRHENLDPPLDNINDTRNGILLNILLHSSFGVSKCAFLQTPNFAMAPTDVDLVTQPLAPGFTTPPSQANRRLTFQHFVSDRIITHIAPHNSDARVSDSDDWPPPLLFDVAYGDAALYTWGLDEFVDFAREQTRPIYYDAEDENGDENGGGGGGRTKMDRKKQVLDREQRRALKREQYENVGQQGRSRADSDAPDGYDMILALWMHNTRKVKPQVRAMKASRTQEKVEAWRDSIE